MSKAKESLTSALIIVAFLALTAVAAVLYGGNEEQKAKMENNFFWQKARWTLDLAFSLVPAFINSDAYQNQGTADSESGAYGAYPYDPGIAVAPPADNADGFWSGLAQRLQEEWDKGIAEGTQSDFDSLEVSDFSNEIDFGAGTEDVVKFFDWQNTAAGTEIIFRRQNGREYHLSLPFRFPGGSQSESSQ